jgi:hypothetical protein
MSLHGLVVRRASEDDLPFVAHDRYLSKRIVRRKIQEGDVVIALRGSEAVGYLRLDWLWSELPYVELIRVLELHRRAGVGRSRPPHERNTLLCCADAL